MIAPRYRWAPECSSSLGDECIGWWESHGGRLFDWQKFAIRGMLGLDGEGLWASTEDGLDVARQNGKGVILQAIEGFFLFELHYDLVTHTAHEFKTSSEHQLRLMAFVQNSPSLHARVKERGGYMTSNGKEAIILKDGCRVLFHARSKLAGRGFSGDLLVWDEAMVIPETVHGPKIIYAGSAVDQETMPYGVTFARIRERGIAKEQDVSWHEWSAPLEHPSELNEDALFDRRMWHLANPSMEEGLIREAHMDREVRSMSVRQSAVELFGVGDWPRTDGLEDAVISLEEWDALAVDPARSQLREPFSLAFDVSPERATAISLAGKNPADDWQVEIWKHHQGTSWAVDEIVRWWETGRVETVVCDGVGPAASLVVPLREAGVRVEVVNTPEHGQACGRLVDMVADKSLAHLGSSELRDAIRGSKSRPLGDAWLWSRKNSSVDISPLVAGTLALGAAVGVTGGDLAIY